MSARFADSSGGRAEWSGGALEWWGDPPEQTERGVGLIPAALPAPRGEKTVGMNPTLPAAGAKTSKGPIPMGGFRFQSEVKPAKPKRTRATAGAASAALSSTPKIDAAFLAAGRELRDRWLEHVNANRAALLPVGKYDVVRALPDASAVERPGLNRRRAAAVALLPAAAA